MYLLYFYFILLEDNMVTATKERKRLSQKEKKQKKEKKKKPLSTTLQSSLLALCFLSVFRILTTFSQFYLKPLLPLSGFLFKDFAIYILFSASVQTPKTKRKASFYCHYYKSIQFLILSQSKANLIQIIKHQIPRTPIKVKISLYPHIYNYYIYARVRAYSLILKLSCIFFFLTEK